MPKNKEHYLGWKMENLGSLKSEFHMQILL